MNEKKVVAFIVEGPSDEAALGSVMKEFFASEEVRFHVVHGDITLKDYASADTIVRKINDLITIIKNRYRYSDDDFLKIIHIVDADGVFISKDDVKYTETEGTLYYIDHIETNNTEFIVRRNAIKSSILYKLRKTGRIHSIPYRIYFNSCNLEHVLYGELRSYTDEEKEELSDDFAEKYEGKAEEFIEFISDPALAVPGTYQKTWDYIEKEHNSLGRHTNMNLIFI